MERYHSDRTESRDNRQVSANSELCLTSLMEKSPLHDANKTRAGKLNPTEELDFGVSNLYHSGEDPSFKSALESVPALESIPARDRFRGSATDAEHKVSATASGDGVSVDGRTGKQNECKPRPPKEPVEPPIGKPLPPKEAAVSSKLNPSFLLN